MWCPEQNKRYVAWQHSSVLFSAFLSFLGATILPQVVELHKRVRESLPILLMSTYLPTVIGH